MAQITDIAIKNAKSFATKRTLAIGDGLTLLIMPDGAKYWRLRYRFGGKSRWLSLGRPYPETTLAEAKSEAQRARDLIAAGTDPADAKRAAKLAERERVANTFGKAAEAWLEFRAKAWNVKTVQQVREYLDKDMLPKLANRPLDSITSPELCALVAGIEERGAFDVAKKVRQWLKSIFSFARAKGWTTNDPTRDLSAVAEHGPSKRNYPHLAPQELPALLAELDADTGSQLVKSCAMLALWTANRPGVIRTLRWAELDLDNALWTIERGREGMKLGYFHLTPLPHQAVAMLRDVQAISGTFEHVFIGRNDPTQPLSDGAAAGLFKRIGYRGRLTMHGFRHTVSTALNELGYEPDWVERQLAHGDPDKIRATYNKAHYLEPRRKMMQAWADYLDSLREQNNVVKLARNARHAPGSSAVPCAQLSPARRVRR